MISVLFPKLLVAIVGDAILSRAVVFPLRVVRFECAIIVSLSLSFLCWVYYMVCFDVIRLM